MAIEILAQDVDGVDADLRRKIAEHLPPVEDGQDTVASVTAVGCTDAAERGGERRSSAEVSLPPATLARALPHIRRHLPPGETGGMLALLRGGGLVFPDKPSNAPPLKQGEEKRNYEERRNRLLQLREQREYARMTSNIQRAPRETVRDIQVSFRFQAGMGANMVLAVLSAFVISYWASKFLVGKNTTHRLVIGLVGAVFMMLIELLIFVTRSMKADRVVEHAREEAELSHTAVGVHRSEFVPLAPRFTRRGGRGVLEMKKDEGRGLYEMVPPGIGVGATEEVLPREREAQPQSSREADAGVGTIPTG